jgi:hypothetical protein
MRQVLCVDAPPHGVTFGQGNTSSPRRVKVVMASDKEIVMDAGGVSLQEFTKVYRSPMPLGRRMLGGSLTKKAPLTAAYMKPTRDPRSRRGAGGAQAAGAQRDNTFVYKKSATGAAAQNPIEDDAVESCVLERPYVFVIERSGGEPGPVSIGRTVNSDVTINDDSVSGTHAQIVYSEVAGFGQLRDLGSTNGTAVGIKRLAGENPEIIHSGYWVTLGRVVCQLFSPKGLYTHLTEADDT